MQRGIQGVAYAMNAYSEKLNITANNIANIQTTGFKKQNASIRSFDSYMVKEIANNSRKFLGNLGNISLASGLSAPYTDFSQGNITETGYRTDFAINGDAFFVVEGPNGIRYTRNGSFTFDDEGYLITKNGEYVLGENGRIFSPSREIDIAKDGTLSTGGRLRLVSFLDLTILENDGVGNFVTDEGNVIPAGNFEIIQGSLETSNVDVLEETKNLLELRRNYESCQMAIRMIDATMEKAANEIGKVQG